MQSRISAALSSAHEHASPVPCIHVPRPGCLRRQVLISRAVLPYSITSTATCLQSVALGCPDINRLNNCRPRLARTELCTCSMMRRFLWHSQCQVFCGRVLVQVAFIVAVFTAMEVHLNWTCWYPQPPHGSCRLSVASLSNISVRFTCGLLTLALTLHSSSRVCDVGRQSLMG